MKKIKSISILLEQGPPDLSALQSGTITTPTVSEYVVTAKINQASNPTNAVPPTWGTGSNGSGNMWITNAGDIFIYG